MTHVYAHIGRRCRLRALALLAVLVGACSSTDNLTTSSTPEIALDSVGGDSTTVDSTAADSSALDSLALDSLALDSVAVDSLSQLTPSALMNESAMFARRGLAFGPEGLWASYTGIRSRNIPFSASSNFTDAHGIIKQISSARAIGQRLVLNMTGGNSKRYTSGGRFDLRKWKAVMNTYNRRDIKAAVARGVADGTIIMNTIMDEPNTKRWGGVMTKPMLDQMARYAKAMFPTLPISVTLRTDWRMNERFRVVDAYIAQYSWHRGTPQAFRDHALNEARKQGMKVMFAMNILDGGPLIWKRWSCPLGNTGGRGTYAPACRMTASQVREWGRVLGTAGCGLSLWRYDNAFMSKSANVGALKDLAGVMARTPGRSCRR